MGPRPEGRGNPGAPVTRSPDPKGFNGAATRRPRKPDPTGRRRPTSTGFNGAATRRPRKPAGRGSGHAGIGPGFNGAATRRPRKPPTAGRPPRAASGFNGAATRRPRKLELGLGAEGHDHLQWGRDPKAAETRSLVVTVGAGMGLQWGRDPKAAETLPGDVYLLDFSNLQWGRDPKAAETSAIFWAIASIASPSMGPRPEGRGNLQGPQRRRVAAGAFNGAATRRPRKPPARGPFSRLAHRARVRATSCAEPGADRFSSCLARRPTGSRPPECERSPGLARYLVARTEHPLAHTGHGPTTVLPPPSAGPCTTAVRAVTSTRGAPCLPGRSSAARVASRMLARKGEDAGRR